VAKLNGIHLEALLKLMDKLDKMVAAYGTHVTGEARFSVYDTTGEATVVCIGYDGNLGLHILTAVEPTIET
jgi:hypothetical protein